MIVILFGFQRDTSSIPCVTHYIVTYNGMTITTNETFYIIDGIESETVNVRVTAVNQIGETMIFNDNISEY